MKIYTVRYFYLNNGKEFINDYRIVEAQDKEDAARIVTKCFAYPWAKNFYIISGR